MSQLLEVIPIRRTVTPSTVPDVVIQHGFSARNSQRLVLQVHWRGDSGSRIHIDWIAHQKVPNLLTVVGCDSAIVRGHAGRAELFCQPNSCEELVLRSTGRYPTLVDFTVTAENGCEQSLTLYLQIPNHRNRDEPRYSEPSIPATIANRQKKRVRASTKSMNKLNERHPNALASSLHDLTRISASSSSPSSSAAATITAPIPSVSIRDDDYYSLQLSDQQQQQQQHGSCLDAPSSPHETHQISEYPQPSLMETSSLLSEPSISSCSSPHSDDEEFLSSTFETFTTPLDSFLTPNLYTTSQPEVISSAFPSSTMYTVAPISTPTTLFDLDPLL